MANNKEAASSSSAAAAAAAEEAIGGKMITLMSNDGKVFEVSEAAARVSGLLRGMIKESTTEGGIPLPKFAAATLERVVEYLNKHAEHPGGRQNSAFCAAAENERLKRWDADFVAGLGTGDPLFDVILAADYLDVDGLLDAACEKIARMMKGKTPEQIRGVFNIPDDFTPQEKEEMRREYAWASPKTRRRSPPSATSSEDDDENNNENNDDDDYEEDDYEEEEEEEEP